MTRRGWGICMFVSLIVALGAAGFVYKRSLDKSTLTVALKPVVTQSDPVSTETPSANFEGTPTTNAAGISEIDPETNYDPIEDPANIRNIQFVYTNSKAKDVYIIGSFHGTPDDVKERMSKKGNKWSINLRLKPRTYEYQFIVDGKRIPDPYNKNASNGKSVITVAPRKAQ